MEDDKIIERAIPTLNFIEQLQQQIQLCREGMSDTGIPLTPKVETLESLLWAKLQEDTPYNQEIEKINEDYLKQKKISSGSQQLKLFKRKSSIAKFKAIMVFIDKKGYMPIGEY